MNIEDIKISFNYHTHTNRNGHGSDANDEEYVKEALKQGITVLGFSEHVPFIGVKQKCVRMDWNRKDEYISSIRQLADIYQDKCEILVGFESEYYPEHIQELKELKDKCDYYILGQHFHRLDEDVFSVCYKVHCDDERAKQYTHSLCEGMDLKLFSYVAHPDYFYGGCEDIDDVFVECSRMICDKAKKTNTPLEINLSSSATVKEYKQGKHHPYPNRIFFKIASEYGVKCVVGFDAHDPKVFAQKDEKIKAIKEEVDDLGLIIIDKPFVKRKQNQLKQ